MGDSWIERAVIVLLLMLVATLGDRQWFRVKYAAASIAYRAETTEEQQERAIPTTMDKVGDERLASAFLARLRVEQERRAPRAL